MNIVVLCGGLSSERDVSISSGTGVARALRAKGHNAVLIDLYLGYTEVFDDPAEVFERGGSIADFSVAESAPDLEKVKAMGGGHAIGPNVLKICEKADITFLALHGEEGENGKLQATLDLHGIRYTGSGYLGSALGAYIYQQRYRAFFEALEESGLPGSTDLAGVCEDVESCIRDHLPRLLDMGCSAIMCSHDVLARRVMERCQELGLNIPQDISVLGFDDLPFCQFTQPPLTTIRQNRTELGKSAYYSLDSQMESVPSSTFLLHTELIRRGSCGPAPGK